jgi:CheY-like chemotaxis protein
MAELRARSGWQDLEHRSFSSGCLLSELIGTTGLTVNQLSRIDAHSPKGFTTTWLTLGAEALEHQRQTPAADLIILDIGLPDISGFETVNWPHPSFIGNCLFGEKN